MFFFYNTSQAFWLKDKWKKNSQIVKLNEFVQSLVQCFRKVLQNHRSKIKRSKKQLRNRNYFGNHDCDFILFFLEY